MRIAIGADHAGFLLKEHLKGTLKRLGQGATVVFRASGGAWVRIDPDTGLDQGEQACMETLLSGHNLLALRVFLGADCGPTG